MSVRTSPTFSKPNPSGVRSPQRRIPASGCEERKSGAHAKDGRFPPAPIVAIYQHADQGLKRGADQKDVKNEDRSG